MLYVHPNSDSEEISLGKGSMQLLGFTLSDPKGHNLWDASDPQSMDPEVSRQISQFFGRKADLGIPEESGQMESDGTEPENVAMFACQVTLDRKIKIPGRHAVQVDVRVKDP